MTFLGSRRGKIPTAACVGLVAALGCGAALGQGARANPVPPARTDLLDRIVAVVNKEVITQYELSERIARVQRELRRRGASDVDASQIEHQVLDRLVFEKVQLQFAKETGMRVDDLELDRTVNRVAENNKLSLTEFRQRLEGDSIPFDRFREELRNEILLTRLRDREV